MARRKHIYRHIPEKRDILRNQKGINIQFGFAKVVVILVSTNALNILHVDLDSIE